jgi:ectoine hydroxylase-related dioxygenase (phytanoyl-CoA dioxygenase family)
MRILANEATGDEVGARLVADGWVIVEGVLDERALAAARADLSRLVAETPTGRNDFEGFATRRVYALFKKTRTFDAAAVHPLTLGVLDRVLGHYQLSAPVAIEIGAGEKAQLLHRDEQVYPLARPHPTVVVSSMWALDDFTESNGATRIAPGSHAWPPGRVPDATTPLIAAEMPAGSVMFYLGSLWHGGGANRTARPRLGVILEYVVGWLRPQENHCLAVPRAVVRTLPERLQRLLGYDFYPPFLGYVDGMDPRKVLDRSE